MTYKGKQLSGEIEELVVLLKKHHDNERKTAKFVSTNDPTKRTAEALNIGVSTVKRIMARYNRNGEKIITRTPIRPGRPPGEPIKNVQTIVRQFVRSQNLEGQRVSVERIKKFLQSKHSVDIPKMNLWRALNRWGFGYGEGRRRDSLKEQDYVIMARRKYLRIKRANRNSDGTAKHPEIYVDETYINKNHSSPFTWYLEEDGPWVNKPSGVGPRLIVVHAITKEGWVNGAQLIFEAKKRTGDYHGQMNWANFSKWFKDQLLENIPRKSIVILDNARYHNVLDNESFPNRACTKEQLKSWLTMNNYPWCEDMLKSELLDLCIRLAPVPEFRLDQLAAKYDVSIVRTPPYHPELQPIETCWAVVKNYMADNCDFTMEGMRKKLPEAFSKVTTMTCQEIIQKVKDQEDKFWYEDEKLDEKYGSDIDKYGDETEGLDHYLEEL